MCAWERYSLWGHPQRWWREKEAYSMWGRGIFGRGARAVETALFGVFFIRGRGRGLAAGREMVWMHFMGGWYGWCGLTRMEGGHAWMYVRLYIR